MITKSDIIVYIRKYASEIMDLVQGHKVEFNAYVKNKLQCEYCNEYEYADYWNNCKDYILTRHTKDSLKHLEKQLLEELHNAEEFMNSISSNQNTDTQESNSIEEAKDYRIYQTVINLRGTKLQVGQRYRIDLLNGCTIAEVVELNNLEWKKFTEGNDDGKTNTVYIEITGERVQQKSNIENTFGVTASIKGCKDKIIPQAVVDGIIRIRDSGQTNMLNINAVQYIASQNKDYETTSWIQANRTEYIKFIFGE